MPMPQTIGHQVKFAKTLSGLIRRGWWEIPEIMASSCMAAIGIVLGIVGVYNYEKRNGDNKEYKSVYMIMRPDDPRVCLLNNPVYTQYKRF
ncbi:hypothetical protein RR48_06613 [Papilio machaon]|uniref:Uncharacterized protein n=1 Tax=Papilio machaon TaxID=76193 RepID=A0A194RJS8_PAPMA|nr:uncharacterized protein LOC106707857 [Papilio machaon]KPJ17807.1 hypothetical protein RR48_06613 [Papilio machaon]